MKLILPLLAAAALCGCVSATATRTSSGTNVTETIRVTGFLENIQNGSYTTTDGMTLTATQATPDQQSIQVLATGVVDLGKTALALAAKGTNSIPQTNSVAAPR